MSHFLRRQKGAGGKWKTKTSCKQDQEITNYEKKTSTNKNVDVYFFPSAKEQGSANFIQIICMWKKILHYSALILTYFSPIWIVL